MWTIIITTIIFFLLTKLLSGFQISGGIINHILLAIGFLILMLLGKFFASPIQGGVQLVFGWIPFLGKIIMQFTNFVTTFIITIILLFGLDLLMSSFQMKTKSTAFYAALILATISCFTTYLP